RQYHRLEHWHAEQRERTRRAPRLPGDTLREARGDEPRGEAAAPRPAGPREEQGRALDVPRPGKAHQGGHGLLHGPRRPPAHARLRQEVPAEVAREPDFRRVVDPRVLAAEGIGPAPEVRLVG